MNRSQIYAEFLESAQMTDSNVMPLSEFRSWIEENKKKTQLKIDEIRFDQMENWYFENKSDNLVHESGRFFSITGVRVTTNWGNIAEWTQPIINQPEIGFLGIIAKRFKGILHFLMQAKIEPGNINAVQVSPTLQATKSNYMLVHKGNVPNYLEYFTQKRSGTRILLDQLQSEQGARFLKKRNRNIIVEINEDIEVLEQFCWLTLGQIKTLIRDDNVVNMDTRTVISGIPCIPLGHVNPDESFNGALLHSIQMEEGFYGTDELVSWITEQKTKYDLDVEQIALNQVKGWERDDWAIYHEESKYFSVIAVRVGIGNREIQSWTQPLVKSAQEGIIAFITRRINGTLHFLVQAKLEAGNFDIVELAPTVQCLTGNYRNGQNEYEVHFLHYVLEAEKNGSRVVHNSLQSEEGGRFYREQNRNIIIEAGDDFPIEVPEQFTWMTLNQLYQFLRFNNYLNIQARSMLSVLQY